MPHSSTTQPTFWVRDVPVYGDVILSPMAGFSDLPYRSLCYDYGSAMSYTEFASADAIVQGKEINERTLRILGYAPHEQPIVFQIFGNSVEILLEAAQRIEPLGPSIIDINMGCSVRKVSGRGAGAGLLREPAKIGRIFAALTRAVSVPVTGKIRLGWDEDSLNYRDVVRAMTENGASLVAVHGRTKSQNYGGEANWDAIADLVAVADVPVIGNGDVATVADIKAIKAQTGCAAVMIGRGAIGHPWIFQHRDRHEVSFAEKALFIRRHFTLMRDFYGEELALILVRKHIARYLKGYAGIKDLHLGLVTVQSVESFHQLLDAVVERLGDFTLGSTLDSAPADTEEETSDECQSTEDYSQSASKRVDWTRSSSALPA
ncbi:MAG: tRNA dihydrouridine synthase DusB [Caldilineaceae bacterium]|nr:tRNA dihydrouridine synthase DusB [Caldilineaceae bacterium]